MISMLRKFYFLLQANISVSGFRKEMLWGTHRKNGFGGDPVIRRYRLEVFLFFKGRVLINPT